MSYLLGNTLSWTGDTLIPFLFGGGAGYQTDKDTDLVLMGNRFYDPTTGRFISKDPAHSDCLRYR